jgi:CheY-like chemotaxis protein
MMPNKRVLVVEDNDLNFDLAAFLLSALGVCTLRAATGPQALARATAELPDLVLMDIQLPGLDGLEVTRRLRAAAATRQLPIVAISALAMRGDRERALAAGCDDYLPKPYSPSDFQATVRRFLEGGRVDEARR